MHGLELLRTVYMRHRSSVFEITRPKSSNIFLFFPSADSGGRTFQLTVRQKDANEPACCLAFHPRSTYRPLLPQAGDTLLVCGYTYSVRPVLPPVPPKLELRSVRYLYLVFVPAGTVTVHFLGGAASRCEIIIRVGFIPLSIRTRDAISDVVGVLSRQH